MRILPDRKALLSLLFLPLALAASACDGSGDGTGGTAGAGGSGAAGGTGGTGGDTTPAGGGGAGGSEPQVCEGPGYGGNEVDVDVGIVSATIMDQNGMPAAQMAIQVCGTDNCLYGTTSDTGSVTVAANKALKAPAFKFGDGYGYAKLAVLLPAGDSAFGTIVTAKLPDIGTGNPFEVGENTSGGVTIVVPDGGTVTVDDLLYPDPSEQTFRAAEVPISAMVPGLDAALDFKAVYGVAPVETVFCPPATVRIPNTPQFAAGADVELYIQGLDALQHWAPYAKWHKVSDAKVSADGSEIVTVEGQGLPVLSTFAVRLAN